MYDKNFNLNLHYFKNSKRSRITSEELSCQLHALVGSPKIANPTSIGSIPSRSHTMILLLITSY